MICHMFYHLNFDTTCVFQIAWYDTFNLKLIYIEVPILWSVMCTLLTDREGCELFSFKYANHIIKLYFRILVVATGIVLITWSGICYNLLSVKYGVK